MHKKIFDEIAEQHTRGVLLVLTGPTGSGKDALINSYLTIHPNTTKIITSTTRAMREVESEGNPYYFIPREKFEEMIGEDAFYEWVEFRTDMYGTQKKTIDEALASGKDVIWKIEAKGVKNIKAKIKQSVPRSVFVFLTAPSIAMLKERVDHDEGENVVHRWNEPLVKWEMEQYDDSEYLLVNEDGKLEKSLSDLSAIIESKRQEVIK